MQVVIEMSDDYYEILKYEGQQPNAHVFAKLVANGIPLPKGHGRLIDADEIQFENSEFDTYSDYSRAFDAIDQADTIIEADTESEVEE